jgi:hypothetical protein
MAALANLLGSLDRWNGHLVRSLHTGITLSSILPAEALASLDRKIPARRLHQRMAIMASEASYLAVPSYSVEGMPEFSFSDTLTMEERGESLSHRELLAIERTLDHMLLTGSLQPSAWTTLWWLTDNSNAEKMISKGSGNLKMSRLVLVVLRKARSLKYNVQPIWVSPDDPFLQKADCL